MDYTQSTMSFHDDNTSMAMAMWREYRAFYQHAGTIGTTSVRSGDVDRLSIGEFRNGNDLIGDSVRDEQIDRSSMGMTLRANDGRHFFDAIRIYDLGADPDSVNVYTYLYPMITSVAHDGLDYEDGAGQMSTTFTFDYEEYYHLTGLNNNAFQHAIQTQLNTASPAVSQSVYGHANMNQIIDPEPFDTNIGKGFSVDRIRGLLDTLSGISGTAHDDITFNNVAAVPLTHSDQISFTNDVTNIGSDVSLSQSAGVDISNRSSKPF
jgi:hypothetical protein